MNRKTEIEAVKQLGDAIGYGNMMDIASALWAEMLEKEYSPRIVDAAFIPTILFNIKKIPRARCIRRQNQVRNEIRSIDVD